MKVTFIGATHEVTGSCTYIELNGKSYLVDYGMRQGRKIYEYQELPVKPSQIDGVFLTHAHIDHSGMLPKLYHNGFRGKIYTTGATVDLCRIMLKDSAHIMESELEWKNRKLERKGIRAIEPDYTMQDAEQIMDYFIGFKYNEIVELGDDIKVRFTDIGHLLGSATVELWMTENGVTKKMVFSGDVGNYDHPIICDPFAVDGCDYLVIESTYGNRLHKEKVSRDSIVELAGYIKRAFDRGGSVIIPSFAIGRTQELLYIIKAIKEKRLIPEYQNFPVYLDSPLAVEATNIFINCDTSYFDDKMLKLIENGINPLMNDDLKFSVSTAESKMINEERTSKVIISSSGMCEAGRIRHHLKHNLWNANNIILFVGYQAEGSLGRSLIDGVDSVKIFGEEIAVRAEICTMHGTSGHADKDGLLDWIDKMQYKPEIIFVNHGEATSCEDFKDTLNQLGYKAFAPYSGTQFDLISKVVTMVDGVLIEEKPALDSRAKQVYGDLLDQVKKLDLLVRGLQGKENREVTRLTNQIKQLLDKWQ